jgi:hypothetical protein
MSKFIQNMPTKVTGGLAPYGDVAPTITLTRILKMLCMYYNNNKNIGGV